MFMHSFEKISSASMSRRTLGGAFLGGVASLALTACGSSTDSASSNNSSSTAENTPAAPAPSALPDGMGTTAASGEFPRTVKHFRGEAKLDKKPEKIVVIATGQLDDVLALGVVPVAATTAKDADVVPQYLRDAYSNQVKELDAIKTVGKRTAPDTEAIANLQPNLILLNNTQDDESIYESLSAIAPIVVTEGTGVNWKQDFQLVAAAIGDTDRAQQAMGDYQKAAQELGDSVEDSTTFSFLRQSADRIRIWGISSFVGSICEDAGLARPETQQFAKTSQDISSEQLDQANGDWLFYGVQGGDASTLTGEALWETLAPVADKKAIQVDDEMFYINAGITAARGVVNTIKDAVK